MTCNCSNARTSFGKSLSGFGGYLGDSVYDFGAKKIKTWTGYGDYTIRSNSLINQSGSGDPILETRGRTIRIAYREYLGEVTTGSVVGAFNAVSYAINPGNVLTFPWLAPIAQQYDQYKPLGIIFEFKSTASDNTSNTALGSVIMATEYDVHDTVFQTKQEMLNAAYSAESRASDNLLHGIECDPKELQRNVFYVRRSDANVTEVRDYDMGRFTIATQGGGLAANQSIGSLYVHYEFELLKEQSFCGIPSKDRIWAIYANSTPINPGFRGFQEFFGGTTSSILSHLQAGLDLGIYITSNNNIMFPRKWAGACFRIKASFYSTSNYDCIAITPGINTFMTVLQQPSTMFTGETQSTTTWTNLIGWDSAALTTATSAEVVVLLDNVINAEYASFGTAQNGFCPINVANCRARLEIEIIPAAWFTKV